MIKEKMNAIVDEVKSCANNAFELACANKVKTVALLVASVVTFGVIRTNRSFRKACDAVVDKMYKVK